MRNQTVMRASIGFAALVVIIVLAITYFVCQPFFWNFQKGLFIPIVGTAIIIRVLLGSLTLLHPERPRDKKALKAAIIRDAWLGERIRLRQPEACLALGASTLVLKTSAAILMIATLLLAAFHLPGTSSTGNSFVILVWLAIIIQAVGGSLLLLPEVRSAITVRRL